MPIQKIGKKFSTRSKEARDTLWFSAGTCILFGQIDASEDPNKKTELIEFVGSSVSANWPEPLSKPVHTNLKKNKQVKFYNGETRGYFLHELNTNTWVATAKGVLSTKDKKSGILQLAKFLVEKGKPGFQRLE